MSPTATVGVDEARVAILEAADRLFYARGIGGVGMDDVRNDSGVSLRRLYANYPSKSKLVAAWLEDRHARWMCWFVKSVEHHIASGADPLLATFDALREWVASPDYRGCAFLNSIAEVSEIDATHRTIVAAHKATLTEYLATLAARRATSVPAWLPGACAVLIDGAIVQSAVTRTSAPINDARHAATLLLEDLA